ncbi:GCN5-related N-acetyltransferase [Cupriavidus taiwanensis]|uniref:GCN5-related N-acetyltransferase n=1 Tax=Cupriavidus taiwanensis TaxID=164546 RepID=A0A375E0Q5_9BURK|nr:GNAT family N-acetyltransferase [Cupriavidus taiwanensis]SOZ16092.1 GCN5-related N-acetyltransferase [Cupriavidus taiwanensis]SOZ29203.1 GCN5-related N-acetyltransferase [Cupriavidus taiwanensis]SOZ46667.1 GCN5-related N-acetyltransferase [Cupriavidus taiwanensis]SOZ50672.1 GCN5-related N-acetyltransferase [Cupriavidus taiwanensis]SOZ54543.1 GCN5-related N-acetyltransferase [Cupriavidus taiwanensis]
MPSQATAIPVTYRAMDEKDLPAACALSQTMRWPHRLEDWSLVLGLGTGFVAEEAGAVIGTALCWKQGQQASLGMIIVSPEHQGKGIGKALMKRVLEALGERCTLLIATPAGQPLYEQLGFIATGTIHQHQGTLRAVAHAPSFPGEALRPYAPGDTEAIIALGDRATGMSRDELLRALLAAGETVVLERDGKVAGFSIMRRFGRGHAIGPVVAPDTDHAKALIAHWCGAYAGSFVRIDVTGTSGLQAWLGEAGLVQVDTGMAMARHGVPRADSTLQQFAIISQALC